MKNNKKNINKTTKCSTVFKAVELMANKKPMISNIPERLGHLTSSQMINNLIPKGLIAELDMVSKINLVFPKINTKNEGLHCSHVQEDKIFLYIDSDSNIYKKGSHAKQDIVHLSKLRLQIIKLLKYTYEKTSTLKDKTSSASEESIRDAIQGVNHDLRNALETGDNVIDSRRGDGYRLNPKYAIKFIE